MSERVNFDEAADKAFSGRSIAGPRVELVTVTLTVNGQSRAMTIEPRTTLLDVLRENLALTGTKKHAIAVSVAHAPCTSMAGASCRA